MEEQRATNFSFTTLHAYSLMIWIGHSSTYKTKFVNYWGKKEPHFIQYFNTYYKDKASETNNFMYL